MVSIATNYCFFYFFWICLQRVSFWESSILSLITAVFCVIEIRNQWNCIWKERKHWFELVSKAILFRWLNIEYEIWDLSQTFFCSLGHLAIKKCPKIEWHNHSDEQICNNFCVDDFCLLITAKPSKEHIYV